MICLWTFVFFLSITIMSWAQTWVDLNPFNQPPGNTLHSVSFVDEEYGWTVGAEGFILHTADGGSTWQEQGEGVAEKDLIGVDFVDRQHGWACGGSGVVLYTDDGGQTWRQQTSGRTETLWSMDFVDTLHGWVVGNSGIILHTIDGGATWLPQESRVEHDLQTVSFVDTLTGWTVGFSWTLPNGVILHTADAGQTWVLQTEDISGLLSVDFLASGHGWAAGSAHVYHTVNGGQSWQDVGYGYHSFRDIVTVSGEDAWGVGSNGNIEHTSDGGQHWQLQNHRDMADPVTANDFYGVCFIDDQTGWAVGELGTIVRTTDGGENWQLQRTRESIDMRKGVFVDSQKGWFVDPSSGLWHSIDGGRSWQLQYEEEEGIFFTDIVFSDSLHGWMLGNNSDYLCFLWRTTDGGCAWTRTTPADSSYFYSLVFLDSLVGFAGGGRAIYKTVDGGIEWEPQTVPSEGGWSAETIFFVDSLYGWAGGSYWFDAGLILNTTDGGNTWQIQEYMNTIFSIHFIDRNHGIATGFNLWSSNIFLTRDGGQTWTDPFRSGVWFFDCYLVNEDTGWATGDDGSLFQTTDGGETWSKVNVDIDGATYYLDDISFVEDNQIGYIFGSNSTLLRYEQPPALKGDINRDGRIDVLDVMRGVNIILELPPLPIEYELWAGDLNGDGDVNVVDLVGIVNIILGDPTQ